MKLTHTALSVQIDIILSDWDQVCGRMSFPRAIKERDLSEGEAEGSLLIF